MWNWGAHERSTLLSFFEKKLLRTVSNSSADMSYSSYGALLGSAMSVLSHPADIGCVEQRRQCALLWQVYLQCETVHVSLLFPEEDKSTGALSDKDKRASVHQQANKSDWTALKLRMALLFSGEVSGCVGRGCDGSVVLGRDLGVLQGGIRSREVALTPSLGELLLGHISFEILGEERSAQEASHDIASAEESVQDGIIRIADRYGILLRARHR